jgi:methylglyoxal synthase
MTSTTVPRRIALIAHDNKKQDMLQWAGYNRALLAGHELVATATTGRLLREGLQLPVTVLQSGPFGGDQQIGGRIADGEIDLLIFFWDPLEPHPHDPDVKALLRVAVLWNIPVACNRVPEQAEPSGAVQAARHELAGEFLADLRRIGAQRRDTQRKLATGCRSRRACSRSRSAGSPR